MPAFNLALRHCSMRGDLVACVLAWCLPPATCPEVYHTVSMPSFAFHHVLSLPKPVGLSGWTAGAVSCSELVQDWTSPAPPRWSPAPRGWREDPDIAPTSHDTHV